MDWEDDSEPNDQFDPAGLQVLLVDHDAISLNHLKHLLDQCNYRVTATDDAIRAWELLKDEMKEFDVLLIDAGMRRINSFRFLDEFVNRLPIIMFSGEHDDTAIVRKAIEHGACDYLLKPIRFEVMKTIWQHVVRRKPNAKVGHGALKSKEVENNERDDDETGIDDKSSQKKPRLVWTADLHRKFVEAINQLDPQKAMPKRILEVMKVEGLTREQVGSHLQKYRQYHRKNRSAVPNQQAYPAMPLPAALAIRDSNNSNVLMNNFQSNTAHAMYGSTLNPIVQGSPLGTTQLMGQARNPFLDVTNNAQVFPSQGARYHTDPSDNRAMAASPLGQSFHPSNNTVSHGNVVGVMGQMTVQEQEQDNLNPPDEDDIWFNAYFSRY